MGTRPGTVTKLEPRSISEAEKTPLELETSTPAAIAGEIVAACGSGGTIGWAGAEDITHVTGQAPRGRHLLLLLGKVRMKPKRHAQRISKARGDVVQQTWSTENKALQTQRFTNSHFASERNRFISISGASNSLMLMNWLA